MTPIDHTSTKFVTALSYPFNNSGAIYLRLPISAFSGLKSFENPDIPKSITLIIPESFAVNNKFSNLRSR